MPSPVEVGQLVGRVLGPVAKFTAGAAMGATGVGPLAYYGGRAIAKNPSTWFPASLALGTGIIGAKTGWNVVKGLGALDPLTYPSAGMGIIGAGPGYNATYKKSGGSMPHNNLGATGDLTLGLHTNRHGIGR